MISGLLQQLQNQYSLGNAPNPAPAVGDPNQLTGLLQTTGIPMTQNPMGMRTPDYMGLLGQMGQQPFTPGYQPSAGGVVGDGTTNDYLSTVMAGLNTPAAPTRSANVGSLLKYGGLVKNPYWNGSTEVIGRPGDFASPFFKTSQYLTPYMLADFEQTNAAGGE